MKSGERPFVVGRRTSKGTMLVLLCRSDDPEPIPGPWTLRAIVTPDPRSAR